MNSYEQFLVAKTHIDTRDGFAPAYMPDFLFDFQRLLVEWAVRQGRAAIFADCGLGKTPMQLVWAENVVRHTNKPVLILTPIAVSYQTVAEAAKFGIEARRSPDGKVWPGINVTNYERLHYFNPDDFAGVVCDESSILKNFDGKRRGEITEFMRKLRYRLLCTATAAPNDYIELGTSSEALGHLGHMDMLSRFFKNDLNNSTAQGRAWGEGMKWRFKGHAELPFWRWVCSWARALRRPSDLGCDDSGFALPPLIERDYLVDVAQTAQGYLFALPAVGLKEQREEHRRSIQERCAKVAELVNGRDDQSLTWCHLNEEGDLLEREIKDCVQVSGKDSDDAKETKLIAFAQGRVKRLVTKPKIGAWGLNFQSCHHITFFPSHSFEQYYHGVRRCWRFGQKSPVEVDVVTTEGEKTVLANLQRKAAQADRMFDNLVAEMGNAMGVKLTTYQQPEKVPSWLS